MWEMYRLPPKKVLLWRYFTGAHLDGKARTNATWTKAGTSPKWKCNWWNRKPRLHRAAWRILPLVAVAAELVLWRKGIGFGFNMILAPLVSAVLWERWQGTQKMPKRVASAMVDEGKRADNEREIIDEIGVDEVEEDKGVVIRKFRKRA